MGGAVRRLRLALARALTVTIMHGPLEALRRAAGALLERCLRGWWP